MKPRPAAVSGKIPTDLMGTKTSLAFLSMVRLILIYSGQIWDNSTNITENRIWLIISQELGWLHPGKVELDVACVTLQEHSPPQPLLWKRIMTSQSPAEML